MEEKDKWKEFARQNKADFEGQDWNKHQLWNTLEDELFAQQASATKVIPLHRKTWTRVAAAAIMVGIIVLGFQFFNRQQPPAQVCSIQGVPAQFCSQISTYQESFNEKYAQLDKEKLKQIQIPHDVLKEIELDNPEQQKLLNDLKNNPQNQYIQDAVLEYYKAKLKLVERIEESINKKVY